MPQKLNFLTFTAQPVSSRLERKPWVRNGLNLSGPAASTLQASHSCGKISDMDETTRTDSFLSFSELLLSPYVEQNSIE